jgi:hypothetical protein
MVVQVLDVSTLEEIRPRCPECGVGVIELVTDGQIGEFYAPAFHVIGQPLPMRLRSAPFGACNSCEFCIEVERPALSRSNARRTA